MITLTGKNKQRFYVVYNPQLNSIKMNQSTSLTPTIGSQYPFYRKNAMTNYKSFSLGGLLTYDSQREEYPYWDEIEHVFKTACERESHVTDDMLKTRMSTEEKECAEVKPTDSLYAEKRSKYEFAQERAFREIFLEFLLDGTPKLLESEQEGKMLVVLTDISLSPMQQLGRKYSSFSATVTEIGDVNNQSLLNYYGLLPYAKEEYAEG